MPNANKKPPLARVAVSKPKNFIATNLKQFSGLSEEINGGYSL